MSTTPIRRLLVANRGEIARRVVASCRARGISPAVVFSDADAGALVLDEVDVAVRLPGSTPAQTYLDVDAVVAAALACGADAVHPGYGFLSENARFARAVLAAGLTWVGPTPESIDAMGSKVAAKILVAGAGVPVLGELDPDAVTEADLPILVKASAGGGGRGMREVRALGELADAVAAARREAGSAFGDDTVFCEPLLTGARHVEVQLLCDTHGTVWTLTERDCSAQRRHQKIVEESPAPSVDAATRTRLHDAARAAAGALGYVGAGTVEMLLADDGRLAFLEVNTRLQVEHPVTEAVHGLDLVGWQLAIAEGAALPAEPPPARGHAVEARLYAEDPAAGWAPSAGVLHRFHVPDVDTTFAPAPGETGLRLDSGVATGDVVGTFYDPMLAKVVAHGPDRATALRRLVAALRGTRVDGPATNRELLVGLLTDPLFAGPGCDTGWLDRVDPAGIVVGPTAEEVAEGALAAAVALAERGRAAGRHAALSTGWRNVASAPTVTRFRRGDDDVVVRHAVRRGVLHHETEALGDVVLVSAAPERVVLERGGVRRAHHVTAHPGGLVAVDSPGVALGLALVPALPEPTVVLAPGTLLAPMPGSVVRVGAAVGDVVAAGAELVVLEAMKMEHRVLAPTAGTLTEVGVTAGQQVQAGAVLAVISTSTDSSSTDRGSTP
ncbi:acetyl/propionyl/methylcrotonyl-CoA carboxylase subunit alpha [Rhodococcus aerolatus]